MYIFFSSLEQDQQINFSRPDDFYKRAGPTVGPQQTSSVNKLLLLW